MQITASELPFPSYWLGQLGEILIGVSFLLVLFLRKKISPIHVNRILYLTSAAYIIMVSVIFYVHFHPNVPAEVLPLGIKPPFLPGMFLVLAALNLYLTRKATALGEGLK